MKKLLTLFVTLLCAVFVSAQTLPPGFFEKNGEVYFRFLSADKAYINQIAGVISVDNIKGDYVYAYANKKEWENFQRLNLRAEILPHPGDAVVTTTSNIDEIKAWDTYPTYDAYVTMLQQYATTYPNLCRVVDAGSTPGGRKIYFLRISNNVGVREAEPRVMMTSSIHGDETTGYILMLRLADYLLTNYGTNPEVTALVNGIDIWINPAANPDGTYRGGNSSVTGARRGNSNNVDMNRNFPDPAAGPNPDGNAWQPETVIMMNVMKQIPFHLSVNFHGGAEVVNYPWDTWSRLSPDDAFFFWMSRNYADTVHANAVAGYLVDLNNGITNGYAWYRITGGRQDYMTYFMRGREVTIEISSTKLLSGSLLPAHWNYNWRSFINFLKVSTWGVRGVITNSITGAPVKAKIAVTGITADNPDIYSDSLVGNYHRLLKPGTYTVTVTADSFYTQSFNNVIVPTGGAYTLNVQLVPTNPIPVEFTLFTASVSGNTIVLNWNTATEKNNRGFSVERKLINEDTWQTLGFVTGNGTSLNAHSYTYTDNPAVSGRYVYRLAQTDFDGSVHYSNITNADYYPVYSFTLEQNYPNPFNPSTVIPFTLSGQSFVTLSVYDQLGQQVAVLINKNLDAGIHTVSFAGSGLKSGMYYYTLTTLGNGGVKQQHTRKMVILK